MSFVKDDHSYTRGVGAIAAMDAASPRRRFAALQASRQMAMRDAILARHTLGAIDQRADIDKGTEQGRGPRGGSSGGGAGGGAGRAPAGYGVGFSTGGGRRGTLMTFTTPGSSVPAPGRGGRGGDGGKGGGTPSGPGYGELRGGKSTMPPADQKPPKTPSGGGGGGGGGGEDEGSDTEPLPIDETPSAAKSSYSTKTIVMAALAGVAAYYLLKKD